MAERKTQDTLSDQDIEWFIERMVRGAAAGLGPRLREIVREEMEKAGVGGGSRS